MPRRAHLPCFVLLLVLASGLLGGCARSSRSPAPGTASPAPTAAAQAPRQAGTRQAGQKPPAEPPALRLPRSTATAPFAAVQTRLVLGHTQMVLHHGHSKEVVAAISGGKVDPSIKKDGAPGFFITPLYEALQRLRREKQDRSGRLAVAADHRTPYRLLCEVLYTAGQAEFGENYLVVQGRGQGAIRLYTPRYHAGQGKLHRVDHEKVPLDLTVIIARQGFLISAAASKVVTGACAAPLQQGRCPLRWDAGARRWNDSYDHARLVRTLTELKKKHPLERKVIVAADDQIPCHLLVRTLDAARGEASVKCAGEDGCLFDRPMLTAGVQ